MVFALNPRRKRRRRNSWKGGRSRHARAARKGWRSRKHRRNSYNGRRRHRRNRRGHRRNPSFSLSGVQSGVGAAFDTKLLTNAGIVVGASYLNNFLTQKVVEMRFIPSMLKTSPGNYVIGLVNAGLAFMLSRRFAPAHSASILFGFALDPITRAVNKYVVPALRLTPLKGLADYLTPADAAGARPLFGLGDDEMDGLGDYLTPANAAGARPLFGLGYGMGAEAEELEG
jgi:hypothetical protein